MKPPAERLDHYQLQGLLGEGGMAKVYQALDTRLQRTVAIKVLFNETLATPKGEARFRREAQLAASLRHPNILTVFDCSPPGSEQRYLVTELVTGGSLRDRISPGMLAEEAALLMLGVARALGAAHLKGIVHRDVKPDNILIDHQEGDTAVKLADFGVALDAAAPRLTTDGSICGSVHYMAPELIKEGMALPASDIWAAGVTLLEMIQGRHPFSGLTLGQIVEQVLAGDLPRVAEEVPPSLQAILTRCLQVDPAARYPDGTQLAEALEHALSSWGMEHPQEEIQRWGRDPRYRHQLAERLADHLIQLATEARSITDRADLLDRALFLVPHHEKALALLAPPESAPAQERALPAPGSSPGPAPRRRLWLVALSLCLLAGTLTWLLRGPAPPRLPPPPALKSERAAADSDPPESTITRPSTKATSNRSEAPPQTPVAAAPTGPPKTDAAHIHSATNPRVAVAGKGDDKADPTVSGARAADRKPADRKPADRKPADRKPADRKPGAVVLTTHPWAKVILDGKNLGFTPKISRIPLSPGDHRLLLHNPHCEPASMELNIRDGEILVRKVELKVLPARIKVEAPEGWTIFVDGSRIGPAPLPALSLEHGTHQVTARSPAGAEQQQRVRAVAGELVTIQIKEPR